MSIFDVFRTRNRETIAEPDDVLLAALMNGETITREKALNVPAVSAAVDLIGSAIAAMPIMLYRRTGGKTEAISDDPRVGFLNGDTGDTLDAFQLKRAAVEDYLLGKGGYIYIRRDGNNVRGLYYVDERHVNVQTNEDPVFKDYRIMINERAYQPWEFVKLLRATRNGGEGTGLTSEVSKALETSYRMLLYQLSITRAGGGKRGFLKSKSKLTQEAIDALKKAWKEMYEENTESVIVLNNGLEFQESAANATEMQLNQSKNALSAEIFSLFHIYPNDLDRTFKEAIWPVICAFKTALNRDLLLEEEKATCFFDFDAKEILKVSLQERYQAYKLAKETGFMTINEIRQAENLEYVEGMDVVNVGLSAVLYDTVKHVYYTPNTGTVSDLDDVQSAGEDPSEDSGQPSADGKAEGTAVGQNAAVEGVLPAPVKAEPKRPAEKRPGEDQKKPLPVKETARRETGADTDEAQQKAEEGLTEGRADDLQKLRFDPKQPRGTDGKWIFAGGGGGGTVSSSASSAPIAGVPTEAASSGSATAVGESASSGGSGTTTVKSKRGTDVTEEYKNNAHPGVGSVTEDEGYNQKGHEDEISTAHYLFDTFGGEIICLAEKNPDGEKNPDYLWNGKLWELKSPNTYGGLDKRIENGIHQIRRNPGGIVVKLRKNSLDLQEVVSTIDKRMMNSNKYDSIDVVIINGGLFEFAFRYKNK